MSASVSTGHLRRLVGGAADPEDGAASGALGGSSVVANFLLLAGLLLVSDRANAPSPQR